ncbi:MAG: RND family transporter [Candidatus Dadabacteria bacterium]|nr:MAG: RND family transporter [Candidatus Dadabacteria bacterium]
MREGSWPPSRGDSVRSGEDYVEALSERFARVGLWAFDHRWWVLAGCAALIAASLAGAVRVRVDNSFHAYFELDDPFYESYVDFRRDFGSDEVSYIVYEAPQAPYGIWTLDVMRRIAALEDRIVEEVPFVKEVTSPASVELLDPVPDGIRVYRVRDDFPTEQAELLEFRDKLLAKPLYRNGLVSPDGRYGALIVEMERSGADPPELLRVDPERGNAMDNLYPQASYKALERLLAQSGLSDIVFYHTGDVPLGAVVNEITANEASRLALICFAVVGLLLAVFLRRPVGVLGPLSVVLLAIVVTLGAVGWIGWSIDQMFDLMPVLLIAVGVADSVHVISEFRLYHTATGSRRQAVRETLRLVGTPCLLTSLTTAAGFASMSAAPIPAISHFGVYSAVGVLAAFVLTLTLLVVWLTVGRKRKRREASEAALLRARGGRAFQAMLAAITTFSVRHHRALVAATILVFAASAVGMTQLSVESNFLNEFGKSVPVRNTTVFVDGIMGGTLSFSYLIETGKPGAIKDPAVLREIERLQVEAERHGDVVRKTNSIVDFIKDINQTFHDGDPAYHVLPDSRDLVAQYLLLYEMSGGEDAEEWVSTDYSRARLEIRCRLTSSKLLESLIERLNDYLARQPMLHARPALTGMGALWLKLQEYIVDSQIRGFLLAFVAIAIMMCILLRSVKTGLLSMVPNLAPVFLTLGGMGLTGVPLDYVRLLVAPVAIGLAVDDTIHHMTRFRHEFRETGSYEEALRRSMADVGRALFITSTVLVAGFLVFAFSVMDNLGTLGVLLSTTIIMALVADYLIMPALVLTFRPFGPET